MKIYLRKIDEQCVNKQISYPKDILKEFLDGRGEKDIILCEGKTSHYSENVALLLSTDPRFDNGIKRVLAAEGDFVVGDIMVMYKLKTKYLVELVKISSQKYQAFVSLFSENDRHLLANLSDNTFDETVKLDYDSDRLDGGENIILYGVPGVGKSYTIKDEYCSDDNFMERLVFHPDYTYSDFVGQILPKVGEDNRILYEFTPGPFTKLLKKAYTNKRKKFYLIIEEINRGNAPAIFGDIFQLLDRDATGNSEYRITNNDIARIVYGDENEKIFIPSNMSILCTMNTSDQNVFTLDTAFQRRWNMRLIKNKFTDEPSEKTFAETKILDTEVTWNHFFTEINKIILSKNIRMTSSEDKRVGTHFISYEDLKFIPGDNKQNSRFSEKVLKYLWDDAFKFTKEDIFDIGRVNSLEDVIEIFAGSTKNDRFKVFKENIYNTIVINNKNSIESL